MRVFAGLLGYGIANAVITAAALWAGFLLVDRLVLGPRPPLDVVQGVFLAYFAWIAVVAVAGLVHELGHGLVARAMRLRLLYALLGPLRLSLAGSARRVDWNRNWLTMPFAVAFAPAVGGSSRRAWAMAMLGGPIASLALAGVAYAAASQAQDPFSVSTTALTALSWFGFAGFVGNLVPGQVGAKRTDGGHLLSVLRREPQLESRWLLAGIVAGWATGSRPREVNPHEMALLLALQEPPPLRAAALTVALYVARDRGDELLERELVAKLAPLAGVLARPQRAALGCDLAFSFATHGALEEARSWLERARRDRPDPDDRWRAEAAVSFAEGDDAQARSAIAKARPAIARMPTTGLVAPFNEAMDRIERQLDARLSERGSVALTN